MGTASPAFKKTKEGCFTSACDPKSQNAEQHWGGGGGHCHRHMYPLWLNCLGTYTILLTSLPLIDIWGVSALGHWEYCCCKHSGTSFWVERFHFSWVYS